MTRAAPPNLRSLGARLRNLSREDGLAEGRVRRMLGVTILGQFLHESESGVIKGATNIELRLGTRQARASSDVDAVRRSTLANFRERLESVLRVGWQGFSGRLVDRGEIAVPIPTPYRPHRFEAKLDYRERAFGTILIEVAGEEAGGLETPEEVELDATTARWFEKLGLARPDPIPVLPLVHQIAQKLHACTTPDGPTWVNERVHDLVDLQLALDLFEGELAEIRRVAARLFISRKRQAWPPRVTVREGWAERYSKEVKGLGVLEDVVSAVQWTNDLIRRIDGERREADPS